MYQLKKQKNILDEVLSFTYPQLYVGKDWYVGFNAFNPVTGKMARKRIKLNHIGKKSERKRYAFGLIQRLLSKLEQGWNPWIDSAEVRNYQTFNDACNVYRNFLVKQHNDNNLRTRTLKSYLSKLHIVEEWNQSRKVPITYIYQFDKSFISEFLDYIYLEKNNSVCTHNCYLVWLGTFSQYLLQHQYIVNKPTDGITSIRNNSSQKNRTVIPDKEIIKMKDYLEKENRYYLLACYLLFYTFIRPKEMSMLRVGDIHLKKGVIYIDADVAKNRKNAIVTLPVKVIQLMLDLAVFNYPSTYYLFSDNFKPGEKNRSPKMFGDYWTYHVAKPLKFCKEYKFYSLKDSGITKMLHHCDILSVRDQARHSDISITNIYTPKELKEANLVLRDFDSIL